MTATAARVRRELVHRANEQEILVSPPWREADGGYGGSTVTTAVSPYYRDHPGTHLADVLLLVEACRQTALSAAHEFEGLSNDIAFFFNSIELEITDLAALTRVGGELRIATEFEALRLRGDGSPKQIAYAQRCTDGSDGESGEGGAADAGPVLVRASMAVQGVPKTRYQELRAYQRSGSLPPTTAGLRSAARPEGLAAPESVARTLAANVALADVRGDGEVVSATLAPDLANASLFDHDYDHFPAMVLIEAGRQLALAGSGDPTGHAVTAVRATFPQFAELDADTRIVATRRGEWVDVECVQQDLVVTRMSFRLAPAVAGDGTRGRER
ncbi:AfsA-related hotdog domain-containing protein [Streptacidiphilus melanogenes]|uniref:AfsA-related hotdog domain-containing protein n=1 Tax=Streptacidiphilus melanogenes TaxID=411235 RepID=UPI0005AA2E2B|nr:AfsA-related hotdog domain-containing protein [Streptacidiphilus melanogenes]